MAIDIARYQKLKADVDAAQKAADKAEWAMQQALAKLRDEFGCGTIEEAEAKLVQLQADADAAEAAYNRELAQFEEDWASVKGGPDA